MQTKESKFDLHSFSHKSTDHYFKKKLAYTQFKQALVENNIDSSEVILTSHKVVMNIMNGTCNIKLTCSEEDFINFVNALLQICYYFPM